MKKNVQTVAKQWAKFVAYPKANWTLTGQKWMQINLMLALKHNMSKFLQYIFEKKKEQNICWIFAKNISKTETYKNT